MLASDVHNPEFVNPTNPDDALFVQFYMHDPIKHQATLTTKEVRFGKKVPYVRIARPGDQSTVIEARVRDDHKIRFPKQWAAFQIREGLVEGPPVAGWKLEDWDELKENENLLHQLHFHRFETVEQVAGAADAQLQGLGMGSNGLREKARAAIKARNRAEFAAEMDAQKKENEDLKARLAKLEALIMQQQPPQPQKQETLHLPKGK